MATADLPGRLSQTPFHGPLSQARAARRQLTKRLDEHRSHWLRGHRGLLGFAYLTLVPVG